MRARSCFQVSTACLRSRPDLLELFCNLLILETNITAVDEGIALVVLFFDRFGCLFTGGPRHAGPIFKAVRWPTLVSHAFSRRDSICYVMSITTITLASMIWYRSVYPISVRNPIRTLPINTARTRQRNNVRLFCCFISFCLVFSASALFAADDVLDYSHVASIDYLMERAIANNLIAGGVVVIGNHTGILSSTARGKLSASPDAPPLDEQTIFDLASLTKVIATTPAVMKLLDEGRISLQDPLTRWFPEFIGTERENTTIQHLLTHTSGLTDFDMGKELAMETAVHTAAAEKNRHHPGSNFNYADINFILLGELVHRVSGKTLDDYCREEIFDPLAIPETMFLPTANLIDRIAPTLGISSGTVQDRNSRRLGSVAGHAGLFSSARDLARFARLMLSGGTVDGRRILSEQAVGQMISPLPCSNGTVVRGLGWDINSPYSSPKGKLFSESSFGHTGYSGSSIWIDPKQDLFVVLLTNRLNYQDTRMFNQLRRDISTLAVAEFRKPGDYQQIAPVPQSIKIATNSHRTAPRHNRAVSHGIRLVAAVSNTNHQHGKNAGKNHRRTSNGRTRRA